MVDVKTAWKFTGPFETPIDCLYLDSHGLVTFGLGNHVSRAQITNYPWQRRDSNARATTAEVLAAYDVVASKPKGYRAAWYKPLTNVYLSDEAIADIFAARVPEFTGQLVNLIPGYERLPPNAQLGLFDMIFNLGVATFSTFHDLLAAANHQPPQFDVMALHCHRKNDDREVKPWDETNEHERRQCAVRDLFESCASAAAA